MWNLRENLSYELSPAGHYLWFPHQGRVPHISLVFREMWETADVDRQVHRMNRELTEGAVVSHISRKTSEMWGTRPW